MPPSLAPPIYWKCSFCRIVEWTSPYVKALCHTHKGDNGQVILYILTSTLEKPVETA